MSPRALLTAAFLALAALPVAAGPASDDLCRAAGRSSGCIDTSWPRDTYHPPRDRDERGSSVPAGCPECRAETIRRLGHFTVLQPPAWSPSDQRRRIFESIWREEWGLGLNLDPLLAALPAAKAPPPPPEPLDLIRDKIAETAASHINEESWALDGWRGNFFPGRNKCNLFVAEVARAAGAPVPNIHGRLKLSPPSAKDWADPKVKIKGWSQPFHKGWRPGDVVAIPHAYSDATGHVGIVVEGNMSVSAAALEGMEVPGTILRTEFGFRDPAIDGVPAFRRYVGGD